MNSLFSEERETNTGLLCLMIIAHFHGKPVNEENLKKQFDTGGAPWETKQIILAAKSLGLNAKKIETKIDRIKYLPLPAVGIDNENKFFLILKHEKLNYQEEQVLIHDLLTQNPYFISVKELNSKWNSNVLLFNSQHKVRDVIAKFDVTWFIPYLIKYRKIFTEVFIVSLIIQLFGLVSPLFFQVIMDKVLVQQNMKTLNVISIGLAIVYLFEVLMTGLRSYVFAHTSSRIDVELGGQLFSHLLKLPLNYFEARRSGDSVARIHELENIRNFLTSNTIILVLDILFSIIFISIMLYYSVKLTMVVLATLPLYFLVGILFTEPLRNKLDDKFKISSQNQSFLIESVTGIALIKSSATEVQIKKKWEEYLASYVLAGLRVIYLSIWSNSSVQLISKISMVIIMWVGTSSVIDAEITLGQLIAFNMLSNNVSGPILRLAQLWSDFQQVSISVERLGDILNTHPESELSSGIAPKFTGRIDIENVYFKYSNNNKDILKNINMTIDKGEIIGFVGQSGSGKSSLIKLLLKLYPVTQGRIKFDGLDISHVESTSLRSQIGIVMQEPILFSRSIRENISINDTSASLERIIEVSQLAGCHEFVSELPNGYDTMLGEHGLGLSGGQKQRIAIARALFSNPQILIFDEATSALDYESEKIVQDNMKRICIGRTVIIIAHRLSAVKHANHIYVFQHGEIIEHGNPSELLKNPIGAFRGLVNIQHGM